MTSSPGSQIARRTDAMPVKFPFVIMMSPGANPSPNRVRSPAAMTVCASRSFIV